MTREESIILEQVTEEETAPAEPMIRVRSLTRVFGEEPEKAIELYRAGRSKQEIFKETGSTVALIDISFDVMRGETFVLMGLSGSGKSTLLRCINRIIEPTSGEVWIDGKDIVPMGEEELREVRRRKLGMIFQNFALLPHRTVLENVAFGLEIQGVPLEERHRKAGEMLQMVGLGGYEDSMPDELSGGMKQRVGLASGEIDFTTTGWLPHTHEHYWEQYGDQIDYVNENIPGAARIGLVVPTYVTIDSIEEMNDVADKFDGRIVGIEPGAGIMTRTEQAIEEYDLDYELVASSSASMAAELGSAINSEEWVVVTGWSPHWKFGRWDLKFLDDPKGVYGSAEDIVTLARKDLKTDDPEAYAILQRFRWTSEDIASVMTDIADGMPEEEAAKKWVENNRDKVDLWLGKA